jgi:hypothetical protein
LEICLSASGGEIIQFENYSIWKWGNLPVGLWRRNGVIWKLVNLEICLSVFGGEM